MLIVKKEVLKNWLRASFRNQTWLADKMGFTKSYLSEVVNNRCKLSTEMLRALTGTTHIPYDRLFFDNGNPDTREFYGDVYVIDGKAMRLPKYRDHLNQIKQEQAQESFA